MAADAIGTALAAGRLPIVVGGTGLYLRALMGGLADIPDTPPALRARLAARLHEMGSVAFHAEFAAHDPAMAARLRPSDRQRLIRAAEVLENTGRSLAEWQAEGAPAADAAWRFRTVLVHPPREALYAACDARFQSMLAASALEEARRIAARTLPAHLPGMKALGLRELIAHLRGDIGLDEAVNRAQTLSRRYAKRQVTWFSHQFIACYTLKEQLSDMNMGESISLVIKFLLTPSD
jgi:tRNA dimethylallyltransferase